MSVQKTRYSYTLRDFAIKSKRRLPEISVNKEIILFQKVFNDFMDKIVDEIIENGYCFDIPYRLGRLYLKSEFKTDGLNISKSIKNKERTYYSNPETMGYIYRVNWQVYDTLENKNVYKFFKSQSGKNKIGVKIRKLLDNKILPIPFQENKNYEGRQEEIRDKRWEIRNKRRIGAYLD